MKHNRCRYAIFGVSFNFYDFYFYDSDKDLMYLRYELLITISSIPCDYLYSVFEKGVL
jgi:hypothetical protein